MQSMLLELTSPAGRLALFAGTSTALMLFIHLGQISGNIMQRETWGVVAPDVKRDQLKLVYDYIKFHIGLYVGTPAALSVVADGLGVKQCGFFLGCLLVTIALYLCAGAHAGLFMSRHVNDPWQTDYLESFEKEAFSPNRRRVHHTLYWIGLGFGVGGILLAVLRKSALI